MLTVTLKGADTLEKGLSAAPALLSTETRETMQHSLLLIEADARRGVTQDTRALMGSITHELTATPTLITGRVGPSKKHGLYVEKGTRPHWPPRAPLEGWARRHGIPVFLVQRAIARRGTKAQPFLIPAYEKHQKAILAAFAKIGGVVVSAIAQGGRGGR